MANALVLPHIFEIAFDALTAAVGGWYSFWRCEWRPR